MVQRDVGLAGLVVPQHAVALTEGSPTHILTAEPHGMALGKQGGKSQDFGTRPVNPFAAGNGVAPLGQYALQPGMNRKALGKFV